MNSDTGNQGLAVPHSARIALTVALVALLVLGGLLLLERGGPSPVRHLVRVSPISASQLTPAADDASSNQDQPAPQVSSSNGDQPTTQCADHESDGDADDAAYNFVAGIIPVGNPFRNLILSIVDFDHDACRAPSGA